MTNEEKKKEKKRWFHRRWLIYMAIIALIGSFLTEHRIATVLILLALVFLAGTIMMSMMMGCGASWAGYWLSDEELPEHDGDLKW